MNPDIRTIFFDVGNTLAHRPKGSGLYRRRRGRPDGADSDERDPRRAFCQAGTAVERLPQALQVHPAGVSEGELWSQFLLPDYEPNSIYANAPRLTRLWRDHDGRRVARPDAVDTIQELCRRGYTLGIIANTVTETEIPDWIADAGLAACFKTVILSSKVRLRKPDPEIYHLACRCIGTPEGACAYVGDNPVRDVEGTQAAGFGMMIRIDEPDTLNMEKATGKEFTPDHVITGFPSCWICFRHAEQAIKGGNHPWI